MALGPRCVKTLHTLSRSCPSKSLLLHEGARTSSRRRVSALSEKADAPGCFPSRSLTLLPGDFVSAVWRRLPSRHTCPRGVGAAGQLPHCNCRPLSGGRRTGGLSRQDRGRAQRLSGKRNLDEEMKPLTPKLLLFPRFIPCCTVKRQEEIFISALDAQEHHSR